MQRVTVRAGLLFSLSVFILLASTATLGHAKEITSGMFGVWAWGNSAEALQLLKENHFDLAVVRINDLPAARKAGIKCIISFDLKKAEIKDELSWQSALQNIRQIVAQHKDDPTIYAWYPVDEPDFQQIPVRQIKAINDAIRSVDRRHPIFTTVTNEKKWRPYLPYFDIIALDRYLQYSSTGSPEPVSVVKQSLRKLNLDLRKLKVQSQIWVTLGAFEQKSLDPSDSSPWVKPSPSEFDKMLEDSISEGIDGVLVYTLAWKGINHLGWKMPTSDAALWEAVRKVPTKVQQ